MSLADHERSAPPRGGALLARQAIVDAEQHLVGYELLFRGERAPDGRPRDEDDATSAVIWNAWMELGRREVAGSQPIWLNVTADYLCQADALPMGPDDIVLELIEDQPVTPELESRLRALRAEGYRIALDDFRPGCAMEALLPYANVVKLDAMARGVEQTIADSRALRGQGVSIVAEKVELRETFERLKAGGLQFFQGYFFEQPKTLRTAAVPARALESLRVATDLFAAGDDIDAIERIVRDDAVLVFRLVRLANSGYYASARPVESIHDALVRIGGRAARQWLTLLLVHGFSDPANPVLTTGMARAHLCEILAHYESAETRERCFLVGLLSVLDALICPLAVLVQQVPLAPRIVAALLDGEGVEGTMLRRAISLQRGELPTGMDPVSAAEATVAAEAWADRALAGLPRRGRS